MQVFKLYFKIIQKGFSSIILYFCIFLTLVVAISTNNEETDSNIIKEKEKIGFVNLDIENEFIQGLRNYLEEDYKLINLDSVKEENFSDFSLSSILIVPDNFTEEWKKGKKLILKQKKQLSNFNPISIELQIESYLEVFSNLQNTELQKEKIKEIKQSVKIKKIETKTKNTRQFLEKYCNLVGYLLLMIMIISIGMVMVSFKQANIEKRNLCSPISIVQINMQLILANLVYMALCIGVCILFGIVLGPSFKLEIYMVYLVFNIIIFSVSVLTISFLIGTCIKRKILREIIANLAAIILCFISGVFLPQEVLGEKILETAKFNPLYWYVKANKMIVNLESISFAYTKEIYLCMLIEFGFAVMLCSVSLIVKKANE